MEKQTPNQNTGKQENICPVCHQPVTTEQYFCSNCGADLGKKPIHISLIMQVGIYALSIFIPPLGFYPGIKYAKKSSPQAKRVGYIAIVLTTISTILTIWSIFSIYMSYLNKLNLF